MPKTIKQIADEIGVSKQAIQKKIAREPLCTLIHPYIDTVAGTKYIAYIGETLIKQAFAGTAIDTVADNLSIDKDNVVVDRIIILLENQLEEMNKQLNTKDKQIADLTDQLSVKDRQIEAQQTLHAMTLQKEQAKQLEEKPFR